MTAAPAELERRRLAALGVERLVLRARSVVEVVVEAAPDPALGAAQAPGIRRLALCPDRAELSNPALNAMYSALTEAVGKTGLKCVRVCDVAADPAAAVMVFGAAPVPPGIPATRVLRADPLAVLHGERARKRALWERLQALGHEGRG